MTHRTAAYNVPATVRITTRRQHQNTDNEPLKLQQLHSLNTIFPSGNIVPVIAIINITMLCNNNPFSTMHCHSPHQNKNRGDASLLFQTKHAHRKFFIYDQSLPRKQHLLEANIFCTRQSIRSHRLAFANSPST